MKLGGYPRAGQWPSLRGGQTHAKVLPQAGTWRLGALFFSLSLVAPATREIGYPAD